MRRELFMILDDYLENNVSDDEFNMDTWKCGTIGCAMGHACNIDEFKQLGLHLVKEPVCGYYWPCVDEFYGYEAAADIFRINLEEAEFLFSPMKYRNRYDNDQYIPKSEVIKRIREFIK